MLVTDLWLGADGEQVCAQAAKGWLRFDGSGREQHLFAARGVRPVLLHEPARSFDSVQRHRVEACLLDFVCELVGAVEVGGGEPLGVTNRVGVSVLAIDKVAFCDLAKERVAEPPPPQSVQESGKARDAHGCDNATRLQHSPSFVQSGGALRLLGEVVEQAEQAEQDDRVGGGVRFGNRACISHRCGEAMLGLGIDRLLCLLDVKLQRVVQMDVVASARPDRGVGPWAASHVDQPGRLRRQETVEQLQGPREFQTRLTLVEEAITFKAKLVVCGDRMLNHGTSLARSLGKAIEYPAHLRDHRIAVEVAACIGANERAPEVEWPTVRAADTVDVLFASVLDRRDSWWPAWRSRASNRAAAISTGQSQMTSTMADVIASSRAGAESWSHQLTRMGFTDEAARENSTSSLARLRRVRSLPSRQPRASNHASRIASLSMSGNASS